MKPTKREVIGLSAVVLGFIGLIMAWIFTDHGSADEQTKDPPIVEIAVGQPAYPGVSGFGTRTGGGRGGPVCQVTDADSFTECVAQDGPRIVVFEKGGTYVLDQPVEITEPYLTIAGQTAPGGIKLTQPLKVMTHDVVIRWVDCNVYLSRYAMLPRANVVLDRIGPSAVPVIPKPLIDSDDDGMPDDFEIWHHNDLNADDAAYDVDKNGYADIEDWFNQLLS